MMYISIVWNEWSDSKILNILVIFLRLVVKAQDVESFNCVFSECAGENLTCHCTVPNNSLYWWDGGTTGENFCIILLRNNSDAANRAEFNVYANVTNTCSSGAFSSMMTKNVSIELNGTEVGCSHLQINHSICRPNESSNFRHPLVVRRCQGT